ncbi:kell blood group glycoprotein homolog isoform X2 [Contarinia nasturtii]|uniref:kell blood group glycoprotein homolog isoform X2 n=1 Tax=Contarinia nasturtii TaxID=265458 RepID=UPI0012D44280|nr:kell blood group glycoprotein homolog isoform X2 [Contarinia nasturtii]
MTGEIPPRYGLESRPSRSNIHLLHPSKTDEIEVLESGAINHHHNNIGNDIADRSNAKVTAGWICCMPCVWLRTSATVHKIALTTATLLVTSLLVASPVLFLLSTAPSQLPKDCNTKSDVNCVSTRSVSATPECATLTCRQATISIFSRSNWKVDPCKDFTSFSCSSTKGNAKTIKSVQEGVDTLMQQLLQHNTSSGPFQKLGRLYESCLRQSINSSFVRLKMQQIGSYMPSTVTGPSTIGGLILKLSDFGPTPLVSIYYDLSYGRKPQPMLIVDTSFESASVLQNPIRWAAPKSAPFDIRYDVPPLLDTLIDMFLPTTLDADKREFERDSIVNFIRQLTQLRRESLRKGFSDSYVLYNVSQLTNTYPFLYWENLIKPNNWSGPILVRSGTYLRNVDQLVSRHSTRVAHNALIILFTLGLLPENAPNAMICTKATMWAMPEITSALFTAQYSDRTIDTIVERAEHIFEVLKSHLKRAPSLKGAALVKLSQLKVQASNWQVLRNLSEISEILNRIEITSDNWMQNILNIYKQYNLQRIDVESAIGDVMHNVWAYPIVARVFYDTLSHSIVVPLSVMLTPYFDATLPSYLHYASVGVAIGKEILRSITRTFDAKVMRCVPSSVNVYSNTSRMDLLLQSGGTQIAYHSLLSLSGPIKGMLRLPNMNLLPTQIFFLVTAQEMCANAIYAGMNIESENFKDILSWLIAQGGNAANVFRCSSSSPLNSHKTCNVL